MEGISWPAGIKPDGDLWDFEGGLYSFFFWSHQIPYRQAPPLCVSVYVRGASL